MMKSRVQYDSVNIIKIKSYSKQMAVSPGTTKPILLWAPPQSVSTAFERAVGEHSRVEVFHEHFADPYYFGPDKFAGSVVPAARRHVRESSDGAHHGPQAARHLFEGAHDLLPRPTRCPRRSWPNSRTVSLCAGWRRSCAPPGGWPRRALPPTPRRTVVRRRHPRT